MVSDLVVHAVENLILFNDEIFILTVVVVRCICAVVRLIMLICYIFKYICDLSMFIFGILCFILFRNYLKYLLIGILFCFYFSSSVFAERLYTTAQRVKNVNKNREILNLNGPLRTIYNGNRVPLQRCYYYNCGLR